MSIFSHIPPHISFIILYILVILLFIISYTSSRIIFPPSNIFPSPLSLHLSTPGPNPARIEPLFLFGDIFAPSCPNNVQMVNRHQDITLCIQYNLDQQSGPSIAEILADMNIIIRLSIIADDIPPQLPIILRNNELQSIMVNETSQEIIIYLPSFSDTLAAITFSPDIDPIWSLTLELNTVSEDFTYSLQSPLYFYEISLIPTISLNYIYNSDSRYYIPSSVIQLDPKLLNFPLILSMTSPHPPLRTNPGSSTDLFHSHPEMASITPHISSCTHQLHFPPKHQTAMFADSPTPSFFQNIDDSTASTPVLFWTSFNLNTILPKNTYSMLNESFFFLTTIPFIYNTTIFSFHPANDINLDKITPIILSKTITPLKFPKTTLSNQISINFTIALPLTSSEYYHSLTLLFSPFIPFPNMSPHAINLIPSTEPIFLKLLYTPPCDCGSALAYCAPRYDSKRFDNSSYSQTTQYCPPFVSPLQTPQNSLSFPTNSPYNANSSDNNGDSSSYHDIYPDIPPRPRYPPELLPTTPFPSPYITLPPTLASSREPLPSLTQYEQSLQLKCQCKSPYLYYDAPSRQCLPRCPCTHFGGKCQYPYLGQLLNITQLSTFTPISDPNQLLFASIPTHILESTIVNGFKCTCLDKTAPRGIICSNPGSTKIEHPNTYDVCARSCLFGTASEYMYRRSFGCSCVCPAATGLGLNREDPSFTSLRIVSKYDPMPTEDYFVFRWSKSDVVYDNNELHCVHCGLLSVCNLHHTHSVSFTPQRCLHASHSELSVDLDTPYHGCVCQFGWAGPFCSRPTMYIQLPLSLDHLVSNETNEFITDWFITKQHSRTIGEILYDIFADFFRDDPNLAQIITTGNTTILVTNPADPDTTVDRIELDSDIARRFTVQPFHFNVTDNVLTFSFYFTHDTLFQADTLPVPYFANIKNNTLDNTHINRTKTSTPAPSMIPINATEWYRFTLIPSQLELAILQRCEEIIATTQFSSQLSILVNQYFQAPIFLPNSRDDVDTINIITYNPHYPLISDDSNKPAHSVAEIPINSTQNHILSTSNIFPSPIPKHKGKTTPVSTNLDDYVSTSQSPANSLIPPTFLNLTTYYDRIYNMELSIITHRNLPRPATSYEMPMWLVITVIVSATAGQVLLYLLLVVLFKWWHVWIKGRKKIRKQEQNQVVAFHADSDVDCRSNKNNSDDTTDNEKYGIVSVDGDH